MFSLNQTKQKNKQNVTIQQNDTRIKDILEIAIQ